MARAMTPAIILDDLQVLRGTRTVVRGLSLAVGAGTWFGIVGANGSGKTTLLRAIAGRLPVESGTCRIDGSDLTADRAGRANLIGFAPPIDSLPSNLRLRDLLRLVAGDLDQAATAIGALWKPLGVGDLMDGWLGDFSSGMRQRTSIALAFAAPSRIVILDEPFNWLDPVAAFDTKMALRSMVDAGLTLVTALHDLTTLCSVCDAGAMMSEGQLTMMLGGDDLRQGVQSPAVFERRMIAALRGRS